MTANDDLPVPGVGHRATLTLTGTPRPSVGTGCLLLLGYQLVGGPGPARHGGRCGSLDARCRT